LLGDSIGGDKGIAGGGNHFDLRIGLEHVAQCLAHHGGVVHDQDANSSCTHKPGLNISFLTLPFAADPVRGESAGY
jgi:hypothetical protein